MDTREKAYMSAALAFQSHDYPRHYRGRVPLKVHMLQNVQTDGIIALATKVLLKALGGHEYFCSVNSHGAISVILPDGELLGVMPHECCITEWHELSKVWPDASAPAPETEFPHTDRAESRGFYE